MPFTTPLTFGLVALAVLVVVLLVRRLLPDPGDSLRGLDRATMEQALVRLGELATANGHTLTLIVVGGAAMVLNYQARRSTQDVDAFFVTPPEARDTRAWAATVAIELGLPADWLNDGAKGFMQGISYGPLLIDAPGIKVYQISPEQLLAMKLSAWRSAQDIGDASTVLSDLVRHYPNKSALWQAVEPFVVHMKAQYAFEELWERTYGNTDISSDSD